MSYTKIKSHAKINLALNIVGKSKILHKIESIVSFLDLHDEIQIKKVNQKYNEVRFFGKFSSGINSKNTVSQLLENIEKKIKRLKVPICGKTKNEVPKARATVDI